MLTSAERQSEENVRTESLLRQAERATGARRFALQNDAVERNLGLASSVASRYTGRGQDHHDLTQVAALGLVKAVRRFDPDRGNFAAYAVPTMVGELKRYFRDRCWMIRPPRRLQEMQSEVMAARSALGQELHRDPSVDEVADAVGAAPDDVREALGVHDAYAPDSLDASRLPERLGGAAQRVPEVEEGYASAEAYAMLGPACDELAERDRRLVYLRFFCEMTQQEVADEFGVTQMQISRMQKRVLAELRDSLGSAAPVAA